MLTFEGKDVSVDAGAPSLRDLGVHLSREGRYVGAAQRFWPVSLHSLAVTDLLPRKLEHHGLLHDAAEALTGDIPKPFKIPEMEALEVRLLHRIYESLRVDFPTPDEEKQIKEADRRILGAEVHLFGPPKTWGVYVPAIVDEEAERVLRVYMSAPPEDYLEPDGGVVKLFCWRLRDAVQRSRNKIYQQRFNRSEKGCAVRQRYDRSEKGRAARQRFNRSEKGRSYMKAYNKRYRSTEKGRAAIRAGNERYDRSEKGRAASQRFNRSEKGRAVRQRYIQSPEGRMARFLWENSWEGRFLNRMRQQEKRGT